MNTKRQIHDGIAGGLITLGVLLGVYVNPAWLWLPGILGGHTAAKRIHRLLPGLLHLGSNLPRQVMWSTQKCKNGQEARR
jgi:hypothetical protein